MDQILKLKPDTKLFCSEENTLNNTKFCNDVVGNKNPHILNIIKIFE